MKKLLFVFSVCLVTNASAQYRTTATLEESFIKETDYVAPIEETYIEPTKEAYIEPVKEATVTGDYKVANPDGSTTLYYSTGESVTYSSTGDTMYKTDSSGTVYYADGYAPKEEAYIEPVKVAYSEPISTTSDATAVSLDGSYVKATDTEVLATSEPATLDSSTYSFPVLDSSSTSLSPTRTLSDSEVVSTTSTTLSSSTTYTAVKDDSTSLAIADAEVSSTSTTSPTTSTSTSVSTTTYDSIIPTSWSEPISLTSYEPISVEIDSSTSDYLCSRYNKCATSSTSTTSTTSTTTSGGGRLSLNMSNYSINDGTGLIAATNSSVLQKASVGIFQQVAWTGSGAPVAWSGVSHTTDTVSATSTSSTSPTGSTSTSSTSPTSSTSTTTTDTSLIKLSSGDPVKDYSSGGDLTGGETAYYDPYACIDGICK